MTPARDDFFHLIHKALRAELFAVAAQAAAVDWTDSQASAALAGRWHTLEGLLHQHSDHEDRHFFALAETKAPGATRILTEQHDLLGQAVDGVSLALAAAERGQSAGVHLRIAGFVGAYLPHLEVEERMVMPLLWATCSDAELAATRAGFMADVPPELAALSMRLMLPAIAPSERAHLIRLIRATAPPAVADGTLALASDVLAPDVHARLMSDLAA